ncbi:MAG: tRNA (N6-isopentenyl adenosine(37)-C2)-methylthiotransferase MiaB, partial [Desulfomonilaceae bacterium]
MAGDAYYIETYGCQMNEHDSEKMARLLEDQGLTAVDSPELADVIVINTCAIREKPEHKVYSSLGRIASLKKKNPRLVAIVAGCVAQQHKEGLLARVQSLDGVLGTHCISDLPVLLNEIRRTGQRVSRTDFSDDAPSLHLPSLCKGSAKVCSYVTIMQGCSNFCSYCIVPYTRGPEQSRRMGEIIDEVEQLVE